jgi:hypothetical protein
MDIAQSKGILDSQAFDKNKIKTSMMIFTGKKLDQAIPLDKFINKGSRQDIISLKANCGVIQTFMLNQVLTMPGFLEGFEGDFRNENSKKNKSISGKTLLESIKGKKDQSKV